MIKKIPQIRQDSVIMFELVMIDNLTLTITRRGSSVCKPGTKIIELKSSGAGNVIKNLAQKNKLNYNSIEAESKDKHKFSFPHQQGSIHIPLSRLTQILES